jgi:hypothetical protein
MAAAYQDYRDFSAEIYLHNFLCKPTVRDMPTHATLHRSEPVLPVTGPAGRAADPPSPARLSRALLSSGALLSPRALRRARRAALAVGGFLVPWCVVLSVTLPRTAQAQNWSLAWTGLDAAEAVAALATAALLARDDSRACLTAAAGGALLMVDAWFDVCTSAPGLEHTLAVTQAALVELPLACAAGWLAVRLSRRTR